MSLKVGEKQLRLLYNKPTKIKYLNMKNYTLLLLLFIGSIWSSFAQCEENVTNVLCADPANNVYIVSPTADVMIEILDSAGLPTTGVTWQAPRTHLYLTPAQANAYTLTGPNNFTSAIYFNGSPNSMPGAWPAAQPNRTYTYNYTMPASAGCTPTNGQIRIVTGGFTYDDYCRGDTTTLNNIPLLNYNTAGNLNWYSDAAGNTSIPGTTQIQGGQTYYVDLGITGCSQLFPVVIRYGTPAPEAELIQTFCTAATWQAGGFPNPTDDLSSITVCGQNLQWYSDAAGTMPINNPSSTTLSDGATYYVSQTINGCESEIIAVNMLESECACIENPGFQNSTGNFDASGYTFFTHNNGTSSQVPACKNSSYLTASGVTSYTNTISQYNYYTNNQVVTYASPGNNTWLIANGITMPTTSPFGCSTKSIKLNNDNGGTRTRTTMVKEFIAGEVLAFDFMFLMDDPGHPTIPEQPFVTIKLYDDAGNLVQDRCVIADPENCIFNTINPALEPDGSNHGLPIVYSDWSCIKLNTIELQGQKARLEITVGDCIYTVHWGTAYFDNFYVGDDGPGVCSSAFGYMAVDPIDQVGSSYEVCSLFQEPVDPNCAPALSVINPTFPIEICGTFDAPIGNNSGGNAPITDISLDVVSSGSVVFQASNFTQPAPGEFCVTINQGDIPNPYGEFIIDGEIEYTMNCGTPYQYYVQAQSNGFKFCPVADCPLGFVFCDDPNMPSTVDLTTRDAVVKGNYPVSEHGNYTVTYYNTESDAHAQTGAITNPTAYPINTLPVGTTIVYVRLDYNYTALGISPVSDCYDIVPLEITIGSNPVVPATVNDITDCGAPGSNQALDLTTNQTNISTNPVHTFEYYTTLADATAGTGVGEITTPTGYSVASGTSQAIYVRVENAEGCFAISQFNAVVNPNPDVPNSIPDINECDDDTDGFVAFDLTANDPVITQNEPNPGDYDVIYYPSATDRANGTNAITNPTAYTNTVQDTQTIYVIVEDVNTGCTTEAEFIINVVEAPVLTTPPVYELCDGDGDSQASFDLT
ncbi:hypothetical protein DNG35_10030, partial [Mesonia sp. K7]